MRLFAAAAAQDPREPLECDVNAAAHFLGNVNDGGDLDAVDALAARFSALDDFTKLKEGRGKQISGGTAKRKNGRGGGLE